MAVAALLAAVAVGLLPPALEEWQLRQTLQRHRVEPLRPGPPAPPAQVVLGKALFFDKLLSGNKDMACATCHSPAHHGTDGKGLATGTGGRQLGRNTLGLAHAGLPGVTTLFWDGRIALHDGFQSPTGFRLPPGLDGVLAAQALFPLLSRDEMRGQPDDRDAYGLPNELAAVDSKRAPDFWNGLMRRVLAVDEYRQLFGAAYPGEREFTIAHLLNALAAFERTLAARNTPFDRFLAGERGALPRPARRGGLLFYGKAGCADCHTGNLLTDQAFHNLGVPQVGPGRGCVNCHADSPNHGPLPGPGDHTHQAPPQAGTDFGRFLVTNAASERYCFRTPSLRNVARTGPWMHDGLYETLAWAVRHHLDPVGSAQGHGALQPQSTRERLDPRVREPRSLSQPELAELIAFLEALTDPADFTPPQRVPSGLPLKDY